MYGLVKKMNDVVLINGKEKKLEFKSRLLVEDKRQARDFARFSRRW